MNLKDLSGETRRFARTLYQAQAVGVLFEVVLAQGGLLALFVLSLGGNDRDIALAFSVYQGFAFLQAFAGPLVDRRSKKRIILLSFLLSALVLTGLFFTPYIKDIAGKNAAVLYLIIILFVHRIILNFGYAAWFPYISDLIPEKVTGQFFGRLRVVWQSVSFAAILLIGRLIGPAPLKWHFDLIFAVCIILLLLRIHLMKSLPDTPSLPLQNRKPVSETLKEPFRNIKFRRFLIFTFLLISTNGIFIPFVVPFLKKVENFSASSIVYTNSAVMLGGILFLIAWGKISDKLGSRFVFFVSIIITSVSFICFFILSIFFFSGPVKYILAVSGNFLYGVGFSGTGIALTVRLISESPPDKKGGYMSSWMGINGLAAITAPAVTGILLERFSGFNYVIFNLSINSYSILYGVLLLGMAGLVFMLRSLKPLKSRPIKEILKDIFYVRFGRY